MSQEINCAICGKDAATIIELIFPLGDHDLVVLCGDCLENTNDYWMREQERLGHRSVNLEKDT